MKTTQIVKQEHRIIFCDQNSGHLLFTALLNNDGELEIEPYFMSGTTKNGMTISECDIKREGSKIIICRKKV